MRLFFPADRGDPTASSGLGRGRWGHRDWTPNNGFFSLQKWGSLQRHPSFTKGWIDAGVITGQGAGRFPPTPRYTEVHPYVMLNYLASRATCLTLAHRAWATAMHQVLAAEQGELLASTPLTLAETRERLRGDAWTFRSLSGEREGRSPKRKVALWPARWGDMINTVVRQIARSTISSAKLHSRSGGRGN